MPGAQLRNFVRASGEVVAVLGSGAISWKAESRDQVICWTTEQRQRNRHLVVDDVCFPILPRIHRKYLASRSLGTIAKRLPGDWHTRYVYRLVLREAFVANLRFTGTCCQDANWQYLGDTQGRGGGPSKASGSLCPHAIYSVISATDKPDLPSIIFGMPLVKRGV